jgi:hypothetical protein
MAYNNINEKKDDKDKKHINEPRVIKDYEDVINNNRLNSLDSFNPNAVIKRLSTPRFLGSYHLKEDINPKFKPLNNLFKGDLNLKYAKSLRSVIFNPITIVLITLALIFNIFWFLSIFL